MVRGVIRPWGSRSQLAATVRELADVEGNRDGVWNRESQPAGNRDQVTSTNPLSNRLARFFEAGFSSRDEITRLRAARAEAEARWKTPVTTLAPDELRAFDLFAAQKAIALTRMGREPSELRDFFVSASGSVARVDIPARRIFCQHLAPRGEPSGRVVVISPGFQETGRNFYEQAEAASRAGHHVVLMDHQWSGHSDGKRGALDSGFGMARDVAAVVARAAALGEVVLLGNSMGGAAALIALVMNDAGEMRLDGLAMPRAISAVLQAPYLSATPSWLNTLLRAASRLPFVNRLAVPATGVPVLTREPVAAEKTAQGAVLEDARACLSAMTAADEHVSAALDRVARGQGPQGRLVVIHGTDDPLASITASRELVAQLGDRATLIELPTSAHVLEQSPVHQGLAVDAIARLSAKL